MSLDRLKTYGFAAAMLLLVLCAMATFMRSGLGFYSIITSLMYLVPLFLVAVLSGSRIWLGVILGCLPVSLAVPLPVLHRLEFGLVVACGIACVCVLQAAIRRAPVGIRASRGSICMLVAALIVLARLLYDRPGSVWFGDVGGGGEAFVFLMGFFCYFAVAPLVANTPSLSLNMKIAAVLILVAALHHTVRLLGDGVLSCIFGLFNASFWLLSALLIAVGFQRHASRPRAASSALLLWGSIAFTLALGILSPHRSRPFYAVGIIGAVAYTYGASRRVARALGCIAVAVTLGVAVLGSGRLPSIVSRSLSTVVPMSASVSRELTHEYGFSHEMGWRSGFRSTLYKLAAERMGRHPLVGSGFKLSRQDVYYATSFSSNIEDAARKIAISGGYHNAVLELVVFCGIPAGILFLVAYAETAWRLARALRQGRPGPREKFLGAVCLGYFMAASGQMFVNGGARHFAVICVLLAVFRGLTRRIEAQAEKDAGEAPDSAGTDGALELLPVMPGPPPQRAPAGPGWGRRLTADLPANRREHESGA